MNRLTISSSCWNAYCASMHHGAKATNPHFIGKLVFKLDSVGSIHKLYRCSPQDIEILDKHERRANSRKELQAWIKVENTRKIQPWKHCPTIQMRLGSDSADECNHELVRPKSLLRNYSQDRSMRTKLAVFDNPVPLGVSTHYHYLIRFAF